MCKIFSDWLKPYVRRKSDFPPLSRRDFPDSRRSTHTRNVNVFLDSATSRSLAASLVCDENKTLSTARRWILIRQVLGVSHFFFLRLKISGAIRSLMIYFRRSRCVARERGFLWPRFAPRLIEIAKIFASRAIKWQIASCENIFRCRSDESIENKPINVFLSCGCEGDECQEFCDLIVSSSIYYVFFVYFAS